MRRWNRRHRDARDGHARPAHRASHRRGRAGRRRAGAGVGRSTPRCPRAYGSSASTSVWSTATATGRLHGDRLSLQAAGLVTQTPRRGRAHGGRRSPRRPMPGMPCCTEDGSTHAWLDGQPPLDLVVTLDDATSASLPPAWSPQRAPPRACAGSPRSIARAGSLFCSLYTDRGGHCFRTPAAGGRESREPADPGRAGAGRARRIEHIRPIPRRRAGAPARRLPHAAGPAGQGAGARRHHQPSRPPTAVIASEISPAGANAALRRRALLEPGSAFVACPPRGLARHPDAAAHDAPRFGKPTITVELARPTPAVPASRLRPHFVRVTVRLNEYPDGAVALYGDRVA